jgi:hypothetical protein
LDRNGGANGKYRNGRGGKGQAAEEELFGV